MDSHISVSTACFITATELKILTDGRAEKTWDEKIPIVTGVMLDIASYKGVEVLGGEVITVADIEGAAKQQGVTIQRGDVVLLHTGLSLVGRTRKSSFARSPVPA